MSDPASTHRLAWELLPWVVNGTASDSERRAVEVHLEGCPDCREEFALQRALQAKMALQAAPEADPWDSWEQLRARCEPNKRSGSSLRLSHRRASGARRTWMPWLVAAMIVQALGLGALGTAFWPRWHSPTVATDPSAAYHTLAAVEPAVPEATVRAVFTPDMTLAQLRALLAVARLRVVAGPSNAGVWSLGPARVSDRAATQSALRNLRADPRVHFAEAVGSAP